MRLAINPKTEKGLFIFYLLIMLSTLIFAVFFAYIHAEYLYYQILLNVPIPREVGTQNSTYYCDMFGGCPVFVPFAFFTVGLITILLVLYKLWSDFIEKRTPRV